MRLLLWSVLTAGVLTAESVGTASRTLTLTPEEIVVEVLIETPADMTPEQSAAALLPLRITQQNLESVGSRRDAPGRLTWQYSFVTPYLSLDLTLRQIDYTQRQLRRQGIPMTYQFFFRPAAATMDAAKSRVLSELIAEARQNAKATGKLLSVTIEPTPQTINSMRSGLETSRRSKPYPTHAAAGLLWYPHDHMRTLLLGLLLAATSSQATVIYEVSGPTGVFWSAGSQNISYGSWTQSGSYTNVSVSAHVEGNVISAYLTNLIGPAATSGNVIASTTFSNALALTQLFSGLSLGPGTYFLVIGGTGTGSWPQASPPTVTADTGVTANGYGRCSTNPGGPAGICNFANPYASTFVPADNLNSRYLVDGVLAGAGEVPEPATAGMVAAALVALAGWRKFRRP